MGGLFYITFWFEASLYIFLRYSFSDTKFHVKYDPILHLSLPFPTFLSGPELRFSCISQIVACVLVKNQYKNVVSHFIVKLDNLNYILYLYKSADFLINGILYHSYLFNIVNSYKKLKYAISCLFLSNMKIKTFLYNVQN